MQQEKFIVTVQIRRIIIDIEHTKYWTKNFIESSRVVKNSVYRKKVKVALNSQTRIKMKELSVFFIYSRNSIFNRNKGMHLRLIELINLPYSLVILCCFLLSKLIRKPYVQFYAHWREDLVDQSSVKSAFALLSELGGKLQKAAYRVSVVEWL